MDSLLVARRVVPMTFERRSKKDIGSMAFDISWSRADGFVWRRRAISVKYSGDAVCVDGKTTKRLMQLDIRRCKESGCCRRL